MAIMARPATESDVPSLLALYAQLHPDDQPLASETALRIWREVAAQPGRTVLLAELDGRVLGTADCAVLANLTRGGRPFVLVENVVVDAASRRRGVGSCLLDAAISLARSIDSYKVQLLSHKDRTEAHAFYESHGFRDIAHGYRRYLD